MAAMLAVRATGGNVRIYVDDSLMKVNGVACHAIVPATPRARTQPHGWGEVSGFLRRFVSHCRLLELHESLCNRLRSRSTSGAWWKNSAVISCDRLTRDVRPDNFRFKGTTGLLSGVELSPRPHSDRPTLPQRLI